MSLNNHQSDISSTFYPFAPPSKSLKGNNFSAYPGGAPSLSSTYQNPGKRLNKTVGVRTNGAIKTTIRSNKQDQEYINAAQLVFLDVRRTDKPHMMNLQQVNHWLAFEAEKEFNKMTPSNIKSYPRMITRTLQNDKKIVLNKDSLEKSYIIKHFKLYGVVVNKDTDTENHQTDRFARVARATTVTVKGATFLLDYWSHAKSKLKPYDACFLVLKKVKATESMVFQAKLTASRKGHGNFLDSATIGKYIWQIVPYHCTDNVLPIEAYNWNTGKVVYEDLSASGGSNNAKTRDPLDQHIGHYWKVGNVHEYADATAGETLCKRNELSVAQDIVHLHDNGRVIPMQFYLNFDGPKMF